MIPLDIDLSYLGDLSRYRVNCRDAHSDHVHYRNSGEVGEASSFSTSLDGSWDFWWSPDIQHMDECFSKAPCQIAVPGHVELQGHGQVQYINTMYPWEGHEMLRPPMVPEDNPVSRYERAFDLPEREEGSRIILRFEGVEKAYYVHVNGRFIGYAEDSFSAHEFDITDVVEEKGNILTVTVFKHSSASWVEDQDFFRFSGIFRPVSLIVLPVAHIEDLDTKSDYHKDGSGSFSLSLKLSYGKAFRGRVRWTLGSIASGSADIDESVSSISFGAQEIPSIRPYSHEDPYLYDLTLTVEDSDGNTIEVVPYKIGFRHVEIIDGVLTYNYKRLLICGVNRHEWSAEGGRVITRAEMEADIATIKGLECNAVRTCHYPDRLEWYSLCDEAGIYLMAETNMESHGSWQKDGAIEPSWNVPGSDEAWLDMMIDRCRSNYEAFKNHASVISWSLGNESYCGTVIQAMNDWFKEKDPSRPVHYEGVFNCPEWKDRVSDFESQMYAPPSRIRAYYQDGGAKPFLVCEYMHCMGNSLGGFTEYDGLFDELPQYAGGFIWDFIDQALWKVDEATGGRYLAYGGDWGEKRSDYEFSADGLLFADRSEKPACQVVRHVYGNRLR